MPQSTPNGRLGSRAPVDNRNPQNVMRAGCRFTSAEATSCAHWAEKSVDVVLSVAVMTSREVPPLRWRVARVDRTQVRIIPDVAAPVGPSAPDGAASAAHDGPDGAAPDHLDRTLTLRPDGVLETEVGDAVVPAVGDWLTESEPGRFLIQPRSSELIRDTVDRTARTQVLAANVDVVMVVEHLDPEPKVGRVERLITLAWRSGAQPLVVLTKADLAQDAQDWVADLQAAGPGVDVVAVSAATGEGIDQLRSRITPGSTLVVVGPSGAGKSTLVNALAGVEVMETGERRGDGKGRHTTTHRELVRLRVGDLDAWLVDTPGLRAVGVVATPEAIDATFADIADLIAQCRFADCRHAGEPGCAVAEAVQDGTLTQRRLESWRTQMREMTYQAARADARLASAQRDVWRKRTKDMRTYLKASGKGRS